MMISWLLDNLQGFTGIPEDFAIPTDLSAIKNYFATFARNEIRPLQALFVSKKAHEQGLAMYYHLRLKLK